MSVKKLFENGYIDLAAVERIFNQRKYNAIARKDKRNEHLFPKK
jgi:hypothetical protein